MEFIMPTNELLDQYGKWFEGHLRKMNTGSEMKFDLLIPRHDLYKLDHSSLLAHKNSYLWRFRPSAVVIEIDKKTRSSTFHVLLGVSNAIALKDVGELNCYTRIMGAKSGCLISPKGVSNEVRLVQAESSIRNRLFGSNSMSSHFLIQWDTKNQTVVKDSVIPIETEL